MGLFGSLINIAGNAVMESMENAAEKAEVKKVLDNCKIIQEDEGKEELEYWLQTHNTKNILKLAEKHSLNLDPKYLDIVSEIKINVIINDNNDAFSKETKEVLDDYKSNRDFVRYEDYEQFKLTLQAGTDRDGRKNIIKSAAYYGFDSVGKYLGVINDIKTSLMLPADFESVGELQSALIYCKKIKREDGDREFYSRLATIRIHMLIAMVTAAQEYNLHSDSKYSSIIEEIRHNIMNPANKEEIEELKEVLNMYKKIQKERGEKGLMAELKSCNGNVLLEMFERIIHYDLDYDKKNIDIIEKIKKHLFLILSLRF